MRISEMEPGMEEKRERERREQKDHKKSLFINGLMTDQHIDDRNPITAKQQPLGCSSSTAQQRQQ